jgi:peptidoglycan-associated lipoprotein
MRRFTKLFSVVFTVALAMSLTHCSREKKADGDVSGDASTMDPSAMAGQPIPELGAVFFDYDSFTLNSAARKTLVAHANWLKANPARNVQVEGHCDERGTTEYNLALGERRAGTVRDFLVSQGIPAAQLSTISYGEERPMAQGESEAAWSKNRRAEFVSAGR